MKVYLKKYKKEQFKNVYFITGTATGGKTTISKALAEKYGWIRYDVDEKFDEHKLLSNPIDHPNMNKSFKNADEFFLRDVDEYARWLINNSAEQMEFILDDLIELSKNRIVVCDLHLTVEEAKEIASYNQIVFLIRENNENIIDDYCNRKSHEGFNNYINSSNNPLLAKQNCNEVLRIVNEERCEKIKTSDFFYIERNNDSTVDDTLKKVEIHFGIRKRKIGEKKMNKEIKRDIMSLYDYFIYPNLIKSLLIRKQGEIVLLKDNDSVMIIWGLSVFIGGVFSKANGNQVISILKTLSSPRYVYVPNEKWNSFIKDAFYESVKEKQINSYIFDSSKSVDLNHDEHIVRITNDIIEKNTPNIECIKDELYSYKDMVDFYENGVGVALIIDGKIVGFCLSEYSVDNSLGANIWIDEKFQGLGYAKKLTNEFLILCQESGKEVYWVCNDDNIRSNKVAKSAGFILEASGHYLEI